MARSVLADELGITRASISVQVKKLIEGGLLREAEKIESSRRGQPSIALELVPRQAFSVGVSLSPDHISVVLMDLTGEILAESREPNAHDSVLAASQAARTRAETLAHSCELEASALIGTGVSLPVNFQGAQNFALGSSMHRWSGEDARNSLRQVFGSDVRVENDATAAAIGENALGNHLNFNSFFYIYLGKGVGGAPVIGGHPLRGHFGNAGRVGALSHNRAHRPSMTSLMEELDRLNIRPGKREDLRAVVENHAGQMQTWTSTAVRELCQTVYQVTTILDPQGIILGGAMPHSLRDWFKDEISFCGLDYVYADQVKCPEIAVSKLPGDFAASIGAATFFS